MSTINLNIPDAVSDHGGLWPNRAIIKKNKGEDSGRVAIVLIPNNNFTKDSPEVISDPYTDNILCGLFSYSPDPESENSMKIDIQIYNLSNQTKFIQYSKTNPNEPRALSLFIIKGDKFFLDYFQERIKEKRFWEPIQEQDLPFHFKKEIYDETSSLLRQITELNSFHLEFASQRERLVAEIQSKEAYRNVLKLVNDFTNNE